MRKQDFYCGRGHDKSLFLFSDTSFTGTCFLTFADFVFDGFVADYLVQNKISDAREDIELAILHVNIILDELYKKFEGYSDEKIRKKY